MNQFQFHGKNSGNNALLKQDGSGYKLLCATPTSKWRELGAPPATFVTGLKKETAYTFEVTASNSRFESAPSTASASVTTLPTKKHLFISDFANDRVLRFDYATKNFVDVFVAKGSGGLFGPRGIAFNPFDDADQPRSFYVSSDNKVLMYDSCDGSFVRSFANVPGQPRGLLFKTLPSRHKPPRQQKMLLVASRYDNSIMKFNALTGSPLGIFASGVHHPDELVLSPNGGESVIVSMTTLDGGNKATQYNVNGTLMSTKYENTGSSIVFAPIPKDLLPPTPPGPPAGPMTISLVSKGQPTTSSSQHGSVSQMGPQNAVDGNPDNDYTKNSCTHTGGGGGEWWQVDLGSSMNIDHVKLYNIGNANWSRLKNVEIRVSDVPMTGGRGIPAQGERCGNVLTQAEAQVAMTTPHTFQCNGNKGRYAMVRHTADDYVIFCEFEAYAALPPPAMALITPSESGGFMTRYDASTGLEVDHWEDNDLKESSSALYNAETLFVASKDTVRTYDSETGEFLETFVSKPGMDASSMVFHDM